MNKTDEALKLALDDLILEYHMERSSFAKRVDEIFEQALAAQQEHEPENEPYVSLASVQERTDYAVHLNHCNIGECEGVCKYLDDDCPALKHADMKAKWDRPTPPPQRQWVGLTVLEQADCFANTEDATEFYHAIESKLKEKNTAAQPAVPLTDEQISAIGSKIFPSTWNTRHVEFARAIQAKLKEKNT